MKKLLTFSASAFVAFALLFGATFVLQSQTVQAADDEKTESVQTKATEAETKKEESTATKSEVYRYVAQPGDTYSEMARKAVQTYGIVSKVKLSQAQIIAAETNLTIKAGSPYLTIGQVVEISRSDVKDWATKAKDLSKEKQAAWQVYTVGVNFNTNAVGESR